MTEGDFIIENLRSVEDPAARRNEARRLLRNFGSVHAGYVPGGSVNPEDGQSSVEDTLVRQERFFMVMAELSGQPELDELRVCRERFERNRMMSERLSAMEYNDRRKLPPHELWPYFADFPHCVPKAHGIALSSTVIAQGGFATIYKATSSDGAPLAFKLFHPREKLSRLERYFNHFPRLVDDIIANVERRRDFLRGPHFVTCREANRWKWPWYATDFFDGKSAFQLLREGGVPLQDQGRALLGYCDMLRALHDAGLLFIDNSLGNVLIGKDEVRICDCDFITEADAAQLPRSHTFMTASREQVVGARPTRASELESLALMADAMICGREWRFDQKDEYVFRQAIRSGALEYPRERAERVPPNLRAVLTGLLGPHRDESITLGDFSSAIRLDYRL